MWSHTTHIHVLRAFYLPFLELGIVYHCILMHTHSHTQTHFPNPSTHIIVRRDKRKQGIARKLLTAVEELILVSRSLSLRSIPASFLVLVTDREFGSSVFYFIINIISFSFYDYILPQLFYVSVLCRRMRVGDRRKSIS